MDMNATTPVTTHDQDMPFLDLSVLRRLRFGSLMMGEEPLDGVEVLDDQDGDITRFLCRASRDDFECPETFVAAAVRRYFRTVSDPGLREMMFVDALSCEYFAERVSGTELERQLEQGMPTGAPRQWLLPFLHDDVEDAVLLDAGEGRLEVVARSRRHWIYGLLEG